MPPARKPSPAKKADKATPAGQKQNTPTGPAMNRSVTGLERTIAEATQQVVTEARNPSIQGADATPAARGAAGKAVAAPQRASSAAPARKNSDAGASSSSDPLPPAVQSRPQTAPEAPSAKPSGNASGELVSPVRRCSLHFFCCITTWTAIGSHTAAAATAAAVCCCCIPLSSSSNQCLRLCSRAAAACPFFSPCFICVTLAASLDPIPWLSPLRAVLLFLSLTPLSCRHRTRRRKS